MNMQRYYEILEVDPQVSLRVVRQSYEDLLQAWDPEAFSKSPHLQKKAERKIEEIHEAYQKIVSFSLSTKTSDFTKDRFPHEGFAAGGRGHKAVVKEKPKGNRRTHSRIHPWIRFSARILDYLFFAFIIIKTHLFQLSVWEHVPSFFFPVVVTFLWVFVEAAMLRLAGTTIGKWMFGIEIIDRHLKKPGYWSALLRALSVWCNGVGTGFFLITPATVTVSYIRLRRDGVAPWDRWGKFRMIHGKIEGRKMLTAGLCIVAVFMLSFRFEKAEPEGMPGKITQEKTAGGKSIGPSDQLGKVAPTKGKYQESNILDSEKTPLAQANFYLLMGRYDEATKAYRSIIMENPNLAEARYGLGVSHAKGRRYKAAMEELKQAVRLNPEYAEAHHILGLVYLTSGNRDAALNQYRVLLTLDEKLAEELYVYIRNMENFVGDESAPPR
ncbi:MAG: tetratricopeptide repeat protein [Deltaproteobacteria bacterium]|nr:tetratricopeptide repeat protein [Deltaproteobacteria bacterium]